MAEPNTSFVELPKGIDKPSNERHAFVIERFTLEYVQVEDLLFHYGSSVLLAAADEGSRPNEPARARTSGLSVIADALEYAQRHSGSKLLLAGHTDTSGSPGFNLALSELRARNVYLYLSGNRDAWASACMAHKLADYQSVLRWIAHEHGYPRDPGASSGVLDDATLLALGNFRNGYDQDPRFGDQLSLVGPINEADFRAFYDFYDLSLAQRLKMEVADLAQLRSSLHFTDPPVLGCGEAFNLEPLPGF